MGIKAFQANLTPVGHFDILDTDLAGLKGGEILVFDRLDESVGDTAAPDVFRGDGYNSVLRLASSLDNGPFFLAANEEEARYNTPGFEVSSMYAQNQPFGQMLDSSNKVSIYAEEGFYSISSDVVDDTTVNANTDVYARLYADPSGLLTTTPSAGGSLVGFFIEHRDGDALRGYPNKFRYLGTHRIGDSITFYKTVGDGYFNLNLVSEMVGQMGQLGTPTDGYFSDGLLALASTTTIADAVDSINENLFVLSVATIVDRNAILSTHRYEGMSVYVEQTECRFILKVGIANSNWVLDDDFVGKQAYLGFVDEDDSATIYVSATGSDIDGYGSIDVPYRQIQRAMKDIPQGASGDFYIQLGAGSFKPFIFDRTIIGRIYVIGNRSNPLISSGISSNSSLASGKHARRELSTGGWAGAITDGSHWMINDKGVADIYAVPLEASTSPTLELVGYISSGTGKEVHPFESVITEPDEYYTGGVITALERTTPDQGKYVILGVELQDIVNLENIYTLACKFTMNNHYYMNLSGSVWLGGTVMGSLSYIVALNGSTVNTEVGLYLLGGADLRVEGGHVTFNSSIIKDSSVIKLTDNSSLAIGQADIETSGPIALTAENRSTIRQAGAISVSSTLTTLVSLNDSSFVRNSLIEGSTTGTCMILSNSSNVSFMSGTTLTNSVTSGEEIKVGGNAPVAFSDLPRTDLVLGNTSEMCKAS